MSDPVCHIPPQNQIGQPGPTNLPAIPPSAPTLQSLHQTVSAMRQVILILTGQLAQGPQGARGAAGQAGRPGSNSSTKGTWTEQSRVEETVKIYQNNDPSTGNFVEVKQINTLTMNNKDTNQKWTWNR